MLKSEISKIWYLRAIKFLVVEAEVAMNLDVIINFGMKNCYTDANRFSKTIVGSIQSRVVGPAQSRVSEETSRSFFRFLPTGRYYSRPGERSGSKVVTCTGAIPFYEIIHPIMNTRLYPPMFARLSGRSSLALRPLSFRGSKLLYEL